MHVIDCSVPPFIPDGWSYKEEDQIPSRFTGKLLWTPGEIRLRGGPVRTQYGDRLRLNLEGVLQLLALWPLLPANVLDFALAHQDLIQPDWRMRHVHFCSVYRDAMDKKCVRCMFSDGVRSDWDVGYLSNDWHGQFAVAELKSRSRR